MNIFQKARFYFGEDTWVGFAEANAAIHAAVKQIHALSNEFIDDGLDIYSKQGVSHQDSSFQGRAFQAKMELRVPTMGLNDAQRNELSSKLSELTGLNPESTSSDTLRLASSLLSGGFNKFGAENIRTVETNLNALAELKAIVSNFTENKTAIEDLLIATREKCAENSVTPEEAETLAAKQADGKGGSNADAVAKSREATISERT